MSMEYLDSLKADSPVLIGWLGVSETAVHAPPCKCWGFYGDPDCQYLALALTVLPVLTNAGLCRFGRNKLPQHPVVGWHCKDGAGHCNHRNRTSYILHHLLHCTGYRAHNDQLLKSQTERALAGSCWWPVSRLFTNLQHNHPEIFPSGWCYREAC